MSSADPLLALRQATSSSSEITITNDQIQLAPDLSFPKSTPTRYRKTATEQYSLEAIYLAWLLRTASVGDYMKQVKEHGLAVGFVSVTDRKGVVEWLEGKGSDANLVPDSDNSEASASTSSKLPEAPPSPSKRRYVADEHDREVVKRIKKNEVELRDQRTVLRGIKINNFNNVRIAYAEKLKKLKEASKTGALVATPTSTPDPKMQAKKARNMFPIIMISSSPTALITMHNVKKFLQESVFETSQAARARATAEGNMRPDDMIPIYRKLTSIDSSGKETVTQARYFVVDSVEALSKFGADAWDRVVCVMTTGQAWQFRPYKWNEPKILFHHVKGIYFTWANDQPNPKVRDWNVTELKIDQHRRHVDKSVVAHFWKALDTWMQHNKPGLLQS